MNWSAGRGVGKLVGRVVAIAGNVRAKEKSRSEEIVEVVAIVERGGNYDNSRLIVAGRGELL